MTTAEAATDTTTAPPVPDDPAPAEPDAPAEPAAEDNMPEGGVRKKIAAGAAAAGSGFTSWWGFVQTPVSVAEAWRRSGIDARRIPDSSQLLAWLWWGANRSERLVLFLLLLIAQAIAATLLYCLPRPTHRVGLYVVVIVLFVVHHATSGG